MIWIWCWVHYYNDSRAACISFGVKLIQNTIKYPSFLRYALSWLWYHLCKRLKRLTAMRWLWITLTCLLYVVRIAQNAISTMAFGTRPLLYELFKFFNIIGIFICSGRLFQILVPSFRNEFIPNTRCAYKWLHKLRPPLSSYGWSWYANIFFKKMGLMFFTHLNISIAMAFIRDT